MLGIVTWFNGSKGYGEIASETGELHFFTFQELPQNRQYRKIERGAFIQFEISDLTYFGLRKAIHIKPVPNHSKNLRLKVEKLREILK